jgi:hypothetical protein
MLTLIIYKMKISKFTSEFALSGLLFLVFISCEKEGENTPACKVIQSMLTDGGSDTATWVYTYNNDGKLTKTDMSEGYYFTYTWETNKMTQKYYSMGSLSYTDVFNLDSEGRAISSSHISMSITTQNTTYDYDDNGFLISKTVDPAADGSPTDYYTYEYESGNLVTINRTQSEEGNYASTTTYEYYTDKTNNYNVSISIYGKGNANLVKKSTLNATSPVTLTTTINYSYQFDSEGKVQKITQTIGSDHIYTMPVYECD